MRFRELLFILISFSFCHLANASHPILSKAKLKILDIGNSYTNDATAMLPMIVKASGADMSDICLYKAVRSGASFKSWYEVYHDKDITHTYSVSKVFGQLMTNVSTGKGRKGDGSLFRELLTKEQWDIIIIHQMSSYAPYYERWTEKSNAGYLNEFLSVIKEHQPNAVIGFYIIHSLWSQSKRNKEGSSYKQWKKNCQSVKQLQRDHNIEIIIPYGTAIETLRASSLNNEYDLTRDGSHCGYGLCRYTAACCYFEALLAPRYGISVLGNSARFDASKAPPCLFPAISVTDKNAMVAQKAAVFAVEHMFEIITPE